MLGGGLAWHRNFTIRPPVVPDLSEAGRTVRRPFLALPIPRCVRGQPVPIVIIVIIVIPQEHAKEASKRPLRDWASAASLELLIVPRTAQYSNI